MTDKKEKPLEINIQGKRMASGEVKRLVKLGDFNAEIAENAIDLTIVRPALWTTGFSGVLHGKKEVFCALCDELIAEIRKLNKRELIRQLKQAKEQADVIVGRGRRR